MAEKLKPSRYNHFVKTEGGNRLAFNALSCGLGELDEENYNKFQQMTKCGGCEGLADCDDLLKDLKTGGFLVPDGVSGSNVPLELDGTEL